MAEIKIPLDITEVEVMEVEITRNSKIVITVESTVEGTYCHVCGRRITKSFGHTQMITLRHLSILNMETYIRIHPLRYQCTYCNSNPTTTRILSWYEQRSPHTRAFEDYVLLELVNSTVEDVSIKESLGYEAVMGIINRRVSTSVNWKEVKRIDVIGIDEISLKKGHKDFVTIVSARIGDKIIVLAVLKDRKKDTVKEFLLTIPEHIRKGIEAVCSDMYDGFINAAKEVFGDKVVVDRFHVAKLYRKGLETLRKKELKRLKNELSEDEYKKLKGVMWLLRKSKEELTKEEAEKLKYLFNLSPMLESAYNLCRKLTDIFEENISKSKAKRKIKNWRKKVEKSGLTCFNAFLKTLDTRINEITNYFIDRQTSGFVEGLNNKIKVIKRRCYGILNINHLFQRIHLDLEGYSSLLA
ncbi:MAG: ISL3 family transposase [Thermotogota bacterium]|nr:ISL3 family transposase [Thermotogota bacterium]